MPYVVLEVGPDSGPSSLFAVLQPGVVVQDEVNTSLFIPGYEFIISALPLYLRGHKDVSFNVGLFTGSHSPIEAIREAYMPGHEALDELVRAFTTGSIQEQEFLDLYMAASATIEDAQDAFLQGRDYVEMYQQAILIAPSVLTAAINLYVEGQTANIEELITTLPTFTHGHGVAESSQGLVIPSQIFITAMLEVLQRKPDIEEMN